MKKNKFLATVLAAQVGVFGVSSESNIFAKSEKSKPGVISTLASRTVDFAYDLASGALKIGSWFVVSLVTGEFGIAVHNNISSEHHYTQRALSEAGIKIDVDEYVGANVGSLFQIKNEMPFHVWCENTYQIKPVKVIGFDYPGLYEYNNCYYILIGNYGVNLGTVKTEAVEVCKNMWAKTKTVVGEAKDFCVDKAKKVYNAFKNDNTPNGNNHNNNDGDNDNKGNDN